jgi:hypothetical protein
MTAKIYKMYKMFEGWTVFQIIVNSILNMCRPKAGVRRPLKSWGSREKLEVGFCQQDNEPLYSIKGKTTEHI